MDQDKTRSLNMLTPEKIARAFEKAKSLSRITEKGELVLITERYYEDALKFAKDCFTKDEPVNSAFGVEWSRDYEAFWMSSFRRNLSMMLLARGNGKVMGIKTITVKNCDDQFLPNTTSNALNNLLMYLQHCDQKANFFEKYRVKEAFHFFGLGVDNKYRKQGIATLLTKTAVDFLQHLDVKPLCIKVEGSSNFSKPIFEKLEFDVLHESLFDAYETEKKVVLRNTGEQKSMIAYGKLIENGIQQ